MNNIDLTPYYDLKEKDIARLGLFICEGKNTVDRMISSGIKVHSLVCIEDLEAYYKGLSKNEFPVITMSKKEISGITGIAFHRGVLASGFRPEIRNIENHIGSLDTETAVVICPETDNPDNLGSIIRTSCAFGINNIIIGKNCIDPYKRKTIRVSMGNVFFINIWHVEDQEATVNFLKSKGFTMIGTSLSDDSIDIREFNCEKKALVLGHENYGIPEDWLSSCDIKVKIPMLNNTDSLNVSVAAGIFLYVMTR